MLLYGAKHPV